MDIQNSMSLFRRRKPESSKCFKIELFCSLPRTFEIQVNRLLKESFPNGIDEDRYYSFPYAHVLALEREEVIGVAKLFKRSIIFGRETLVVGGFGSVATKNNKRRKGVATALLKRGIEDFKMRNFDIAFLCTDLSSPGLTRLYAQVGFIPLGKPYTYKGKSGKKYEDHNGMVAPIGATDKFKHILSSKVTLDIGMGSW